MRVKSMGVDFRAELAMALGVHSSAAAPACSREEHDKPRSERKTSIDRHEEKHQTAAGRVNVWRTLAFSPALANLLYLLSKGTICP
jgi:hypothetical protein